MDIVDELVKSSWKIFQMSVAGDSNGGVSENDLRRRFEGQLNKFTNVVKGWQYRKVTLLYNLLSLKKHPIAIAKLFF